MGEATPALNGEAKVGALPLHRCASGANEPQGNGALPMNNVAIAVRPSGLLQGSDLSFRNDVVAGLGNRMKSLPAKYLYDAAGSALFDLITGVEEYYVTRSEIG